MEIVTGDETWIHHFDPENKEKTRWMASDGERPVLHAERRLLVKPCVLFSLMDTVQVLEKVVKGYTERRPRTGTRGLYHLHDNAPAHKSAIVANYLQEINLKVIEHPHTAQTSPLVTFGCFQN